MLARGFSPKLFCSGHGRIIGGLRLRGTVARFLLQNHISFSSTEEAWGGGSNLESFSDMTQVSDSG